MLPKLLVVLFWVSTEIPMTRNKKSVMGHDLVSFFLVDRMGSIFCLC